MAPTTPPPPSYHVDWRRVRSYLLRLPLCTRVIIFLIIAFFAAERTVPWFGQWACLRPSAVSLSTMHRLNTYPLLHLNFAHFILNIIALLPLLERFESEHGTLVTLALFSGPFATLPGALYILIEKYLWRHDTAVAGASVWGFLLLASEAIKMWRAHPCFDIAGIKISTWTYPCFVCLVISVLVPDSSFTGHVCALIIGYLWGLGYIKFLVPSERILRWVEGKLNLLGRLPHYVSVDQKTYGRYGVLPSTSAQRTPSLGPGIHLRSAGQRLGP